MNIFLFVFILGIGLAMDAVAVSLVNGLSYKNLKYKQMLYNSFIFAFFQALFPLIGFFLGQIVANKIEYFTKAISFLLLLFIGLKMFFEGIKSIREKNNGEQVEKVFNYKKATIQGIAVSIDAFVAGITLASNNINIFIAISIIAAITFVFSFVAINIGKIAQKKVLSKAGIADIVGGVILILLAISIWFR